MAHWWSVKKLSDRLPSMWKCYNFLVCNKIEFYVVEGKITHSAHSKNDINKSGPRAKEKLGSTVLDTSRSLAASRSQLV